MQCISIKTCFAFILGLFIISCTSTPVRNVASEEDSYNRLRQRAQQADIVGTVTSLHEGIQVAPESASFPERMARVVAYNVLTQSINLIEDALDAADGIRAMRDKNDKVSTNEKAAMVSIPTAAVVALVANNYVVSLTPLGDYRMISKIPATDLDRAQKKLIDQDGLIDVDETSRKGTVITRKSKQGNYKVFEADLTAANEDVAKVTKKAATATPPPPPPEPVSKTSNQVQAKAKSKFVVPNYGTKKSAKAAEELTSKFKSTKKAPPSLILGESVAQQPVDRYLEVKTRLIKKPSSFLGMRGLMRNGLLLAGFAITERALNHLIDKTIPMNREDAEDLLNAAKEAEQMMRQDLPMVDEAP